ncbi:hypothetical protein [Streptomyces sp. NPDC050564]|uniref:hypothetical protein n=1 Tax=Streptomyces sp. NPDC050564 TaxID=3365631 RepID=UPI00378DEC01
MGTLVGFACCNVLTALSSSYPLTFVARLVAGVMGRTLWAMLVGYAARMVPAERRGRPIALVPAGITFALSRKCPRSPHRPKSSARARPSPYWPC